MSDIEPSHNPDDDMPPGEHPEGVTRTTATKPKRLPGAALVSGLVLFPFIALSVVGLLILLSESGTDFSVMAYCVIQIVALALIWNYLRKADGWGKVALGLAIGIGFYLLTFGMCGSQI